LLIPADRGHIYVAVDNVADYLLRLYFAIHTWLSRDPVSRHAVHPNQISPKQLNLAARVVETRAELAITPRSEVKALLQQAIERDLAQIGKPPLPATEHQDYSNTLRKQAEKRASGAPIEAMENYRQAMGHAMLGGDETLALACYNEFRRLREHVKYAY
jgi:hypothetical protein